MKINDMDIYDLFKEENQQFWDFLELALIDTNTSIAERAQMYKNYVLEEIEAL